MELVRSWIDESSVPVSRLYQRLTPDHFVARAVPELRRLRDLLAGDGLEWDVVEAMADVCFPDDPADRYKPRLGAARALWDRAQASPTPLAGAQELELARELLVAKDRTIEIYQEMQRLQTAYEASERGRTQALQVAALLFVMLGQAQANVAELKRRADALHQMPSARQPEEHTALELRLSRAQRQQEELGEQLARAQDERDTAQQVADHAARRIQILEGELAELRFRMGQDDPARPENSAQALPQPDLRAASHSDAVLGDIDRALEKVRTVLDEEHAAVRQAADDAGYPTSPGRTLPTADTPRMTTVPGHVQRVSESDLASRQEYLARLSRTMRNNLQRPHHSRWARPGTMKVDLRERIRVNSKLPRLPRSWHREMGLRPAPGELYSSDFVVAALTNYGRGLEVALTDVSGKGTEGGSRALLLTGAFSGLLGSVQPYEFLPAANRYLLRQDWDEAFATSIYLYLDLVLGSYELYSAGHVPGLRFNAGDGYWEKQSGEGPLLGVIDGAEFLPSTGTLSRGDVLMLFTDGVFSGYGITEGIARLVGEADRYMADGFDGAGWNLLEAVADDFRDDRALITISRKEW